MRIFKQTAVLLMMLVLAGCQSTGLSLREKGSFNYSNFIYGLYGGEKGAESEPKDLIRPIRVAVAQIGETAPPENMMKKLKEEHYLVDRAVPIPAGAFDFNFDNEKDEIVVMTDRMREMAKDLGVDYVFLFGGSADYGKESNFLQFFDITLVGAYVLPSYKHTAEGRASGALIDAKTGRVQFIVNSEGRVSRHTPSYFSYFDLYGSSGDTKVLTLLRDDLVTKLSDAFIEELKTVDQEA